MLRTIVTWNNPNVLDIPFISRNIGQINTSDFYTEIVNLSRSIQFQPFCSGAQGSHTLNPCYIIHQSDLLENMCPHKISTDTY